MEEYRLLEPVFDKSEAWLLQKSEQGHGVAVGLLWGNLDRIRHEAWVSPKSGRGSR